MDHGGSSGRPGGGNITESVARIEILTYFQRRPGARETVVELAEALGGDEVNIQRQLEKLVSLGILARDDGAGTPVYTYLSTKKGRQEHGVG